MSLDGKIAVVTGAGTGIGQGIAVELGKRGAKVAVHYNRSDAGAKETAERIAAAGGEAFLVQADVSNRLEIERMMKQTARHYGGIDILDAQHALFDQMHRLAPQRGLQPVRRVTRHLAAKNDGFLADQRVEASCRLDRRRVRRFAVLRR